MIRTITTTATTTAAAAAATTTTTTTAITTTTTSTTVRICFSWKCLSPRSFQKAGVDPHESDAFGKLGLSHQGLRERNRLTYETALAHNSKLVVTMGGGYPRNLDVDSRQFGDVVAAHVDVYRDCADVHAER